MQQMCEIRWHYVAFARIAHMFEDLIDCKPASHIQMTWFGLLQEMSQLM